MLIDLTPKESEYVKHLLETARKELLHELHHTYGHEFKDALKKQFDLNEAVTKKVQAPKS